MKTNQVEVKGIDVRYKKINQNEYISLTDIAKYKNPADPRFIVYSWLRNNAKPVDRKTWRHRKIKIYKIMQLYIS